MQVRGAKTVRWMPSDGHSPYVGENGNWWQWNDKLQRYVDTGVSAKGVQGMPGQIPFQKEWKAGDTHRNDTNIVDYIYVRSADPNSRKWYKLKDTYVIRTVPSDETEPSADTLSTYYEEIPWMSELAINVLLVEEGNIANFIFKDGKLISVRGTVDGVEADYAGQANFVPNIVLDGKTGKVISNDSEVRGTVYAVDGEFSGEVKGVTGSFKRLYAVDDAGNIQGLITFRDGGQIEFDSDIYNQGYNVKKARNNRLYASDIWCMGTFGAAQRNTLVVYGTYGRYYTKGLDNPYYEERYFIPRVDSNNNTYYIIPLYGGGAYEDAGGFAADLVIFLSSTSYRYLLNGAPGKKVTLINGHDKSNPPRIYSMGHEVELHGGAVREFYNIGDFHYPVLDTSVLGRGWIAGAESDNNWG